MKTLTFQDVIEEDKSTFICKSEVKTVVYIYSPAPPMSYVIEPFKYPCPGLSYINRISILLYVKH